MPITVETPRIVAHLCAERDGTTAPIGTGFFVGMRGQHTLTFSHVYLVTARHIVAHARTVYVRLTDPTGQTQDQRLDNWFVPDDNADVAVAPMPGFDGTGHLLWPYDDFLTADDDQPYLGDNVYFIGMFSFVPSMGAKNIPMVRSGTLGALNQDDIPIVTSDRVTSTMNGHLIDCRAYSGFSGAPCLVQTPNGVTRLLGVISAHFDASVPLQGAPGDPAFEPRVPVHAGVGVVTPVEALDSLLKEPRLVELRALTDAALSQE
ncbi:MAG TPA: trypsin-like peptidase domain-containing protein [Conexibacter sp.]|nr:trypsin-like peptidase domain-containing protein [Conexibacter sp.]